MGQFRELLPRDFKDFLEQHKFKIETVHAGQLHVIYNPTFTLKIYDCMGHGYGVNVNLCSSFDTSIYEGDEIAINWVFKYYKLQETSNFRTRTEGAHLKNLKPIYSDLQLVLTSHIKTVLNFLNEPVERIQQLAREHFSS